MGTALPYYQSLYVYGWQQWDFFALAEQQAIITLQTAMSVAYEQWLERSDVQITGRDRDGRQVVLDGVSPRLSALRRVARDRRLRNRRAGSIRVPWTEAGVTEALRELGYFTPWESTRARHLVAIRNDLVHSAFAQKHLQPWAADVIGHVVDLINAIWIHRAVSASGPRTNEP